MSEYTFETAALKAVTIDAVKYNEEGLKNSLTPETIQTVVPIAWYDNGTAAATNFSASAFGVGSHASTNATALGYKATAFTNAIAIGYCATTENGTYHQIVVGQGAEAKQHCGIAFGSNFGENVNGSITWHSTKTEGTGSITIGAGANTLNYIKADGTVIEASNSVTIGCKANSVAHDSVLIGAHSSCTRQWDTPCRNVVIGANASTNSTSDIVIGYSATSKRGNSVVLGGNAISDDLYTTAIGNFTETKETYTTAIGYSAKAIKQHGTAIGTGAKAEAVYSTAIGRRASVSDYGATVIRSTAEDGTYTQLYFSGANTPLAKKYFPTAWEQKQDVDPETGDPVFDDDGNPVMVDDPEKPIAGEAMMGFVAKDKDGNVIARGANMLSALFPYYTGEDDDPFQPTGMSLRGGEKPEPIAFHPSDLDMTTEELANEPEEYEPLPVYPIVEPEMQEPEMSEYEPLPVYPIVEPETPEIEE